MQHLNHSLQPACNFLMYAGSHNTEHVKVTQKKHGKLFMVLELCCGLLGLDIANRFGINQFSHIEINYLVRISSPLDEGSRSLFGHHANMSRKPCHKLTKIPVPIPESLIVQKFILKCQHHSGASHKLNNILIRIIILLKASLGYHLLDIQHLYNGRSSDKQITKDCGIFYLLEA